MIREKIQPKRATSLRKNSSRVQEMYLNSEYYESIYLINGNSFITRKLTDEDLLVQPDEYFMLMNMGDEEITVDYSEDPTKLEVIYDPYLYETSEKLNYTEEYFRQNYDIPEGYIDTLPKWYSFKFTYPDYNLIFLRPSLGISIQIHKHRNEFWTILEGCPIILNGSRVYYFVKNGTKFEIPISTFHTVINPNHQDRRFVVLEERWNGYFDERDIERIFNPNHYK